jgi:hypothetical protein
MIALIDASGKMSPLSYIYFSVYSSEEVNMNLKPPRKTVRPIKKSFSV